MPPRRQNNNSDQDTSWNEWSRYVLAELIRLNEKQEAFDLELKKINIDIATLKVKSGVWGLIGGVIPVAIAITLELLKK